MIGGRALVAAAGIAALIVLQGCTSSGSPSGGSGSTSSAASSSGAASTAGSSSAASAPATSISAAPAPHSGHVVVVMMENHSFADVIGNSGAPYINSLAAHGANLTAMYATTHPSQPNYVALFSGGQQGVTTDVCPQILSGPNLGQQLLASHFTFAGYSEGLPNTANQVCTDGRYARRHAPWTNFSNLPGTVSQPFTNFPSDYARLPSLSFVVPNLDDDMHDGTVAAGDAWLKAYLSAYATWAATHGSQLVVTWDEDDRSASNHIPTVIVGAGITPQRISTHLTTYSLLRWLEDRFGLAHLGTAASAPRVPLPTS